MIITLLVLITSLYSFDLEHGFGISSSPQKNDVSYRATFLLPDQLQFYIEPAVNLNDTRDSFLKFELLKEFKTLSAFFRVQNIASSLHPIKMELGLEIPYQAFKLSLGVLYNQKQVFPYTQLSLTLGKFEPYISLSDQILLGLYYGLQSVEDSTKISDYFRIISPYNHAETRSGEAYIKGYYLDSGEIKLNGNPLKLRADGMFIEKVSLPYYGENLFTFTIKGKTISSYEQKFAINRIYPFIDIPYEDQKKWLSIVEKIDFPNGNYFKPDAEVSRQEFYLNLAKLANMERNKYVFKNYFTDVDNEELKDYLYTYYGKGILKVAYKKFYPNSSIKREEAMTVLSRFLPDKEIFEDYEFKDIPQKSWVYSNVNKLRNFSIINETVINPKGTLARKDFFNYMAKLVEFIKIPAPIENVTKVEQPEIVVEAPNQSSIFDVFKTAIIGDKGEYGFKDITFISPKGDESVPKTPYFVKGYAPPGMTFIVNSKNVVVNRHKRFAAEVNLDPGINKIEIRVNNETKSYLILYIKKFSDLSQNEYFTDLIEKIATLGYMDTDEQFYPARYVTREELLLAMVRLGYIKESRIKEMSDEDKTAEVSYQEAISIINKLAGLRIEFDASNEDVLTRKVFALLLYEIPKVHDEVKKFYSN
ncbi:MAG: hypothetical protein A2Y40_06710 [Candidatus Margulisbacteria bacterium GWF2_35_9]|nr:MAG: hypothetical protein A2Y40_06710 [Candidatus Margulisbacteria bacterium GWF2_35_9]